MYPKGYKAFVFETVHLSTQISLRMADSDLSASELRQRYHRGGTLKDDELTSAQLRAKYAIPGNRKGESEFIIIRSLNIVR
jgi:hypothetical protein